MTESKKNILENSVTVKRMDHGGDRLIYRDREITINKTIGDLTEEESQEIIEFLKIGEEQSQKAQKRQQKKEAKPCECGCGAYAKPGRKFIPGHDSKLKSKLLKKYKQGDQEAENELIKRGWLKS